jgi:hypothetical protein
MKKILTFFQNIKFLFKYSLYDNILIKPESWNEDENFRAFMKFIIPKTKSAMSSSQ